MKFTSSITNKQPLPAATAVLYHYPCPDGVFAALAAHLYFSATSQPVMFFPNTVYNPIKPEDLPIDDIQDVYLLDFFGPSGFVPKISSLINKLWRRFGGGGRKKMVEEEIRWWWEEEDEHVLGTCPLNNCVHVNYFIIAII
ncbi:hypothetical protein ACHQM5_004558 [Ranunculus cassubicifolius]